MPAHRIPRFIKEKLTIRLPGRYWLDVARYSDARNVGERFPYSYTYRDWVIRALNEDMPYDRFVKLQLAADQLPENHDRRNLAALGFLSLGREFPKTFPETVDDRIDTVTRGLLGLTVACARCHDHKYDPIPTKDYYSLYSIFSNIREPRELPLLSPAARKTPLDNVWEPRLDRIRAIDAEYRVKRNAEMTAFFKTQIADYLLAVRDAAKMSNTEVEDLVKERQLNLHLLGRWRRYLKQSQASGEPVFKLWHTLALPNPNLEGAHPRIAQAFKDQPPQTIREAAALYQTVLLRDHLAIDEANSPLNLPVNEFELIFTEGDGNNTIAFGVRYDTTRALYAYAGAAPRAMAVEDLPDPKIARVFIRGNANNPGAETPPHAPSCLSPAEPQAFEKGSGRLGLAEFIGSRDNPVTARVIVNRVWLHHFGAGIVRTPSDFGLRGDAPSHPELLDYLATRFMESGWSLKTLHRLILMSAAYRQSSMDNPASRKLDPDNQLYWRMHRQRLDIEALRDSLLAASGQLDLAPGGPPYSLTVQPAVPRRTVYGYIERGRIPGFLSNFDFASPDTHVPLRSATTVPQQALFLINSAFVTDQARALAASTSGDVGARIQAMYRSAYQRDATPQELALGLRFIASAPPEAPEPAETSAWHYGFGAPFQPFPYFTGDAWRNPGGSARIQASGGHPGDYQGDVAVLRWVSPVAGKVSTEGTLRHNQSAIPSGDGVRARIVSSRHGELASWIVNGTGAETGLSGIAVEKGDTLDFIVDGRADTENDSYNWAPRIRLAGTETRWDAAKDFRGPTPKPLDTWARYAQILLETNEFAFVD